MANDWIEHIYPCPVCAWAMRHPASDYNICPRCGTEFGNDDDDPIMSKGECYEVLRNKWIKGGRSFWFNRKKEQA